MEQVTAGLSIKEGQSPGGQGGCPGSGNSTGRCMQERNSRVYLGNCRPLSIAEANIITEGHRLSTQVGPRSPRASFIMSPYYFLLVMQSQRNISHRERPSDFIQLYAFAKCIFKTHTDTSFENICKGV